MRKACGLSLALSLVLAVGAASAQDKPKEIRRDPNGVTGISPFMEEVAKGRKAFVEKNVDGAIASFEKATREDDRKALGYLLLAQALMEKGELTEALLTIEAGQKKDGSEDEQAKLMVLRGDVLERQNAPRKDAKGNPKDTAASVWEEVKAVWSGIAAFHAGHPKALDFTTTADSRKTKIDERVKLDKDYGEVKKRIDKEKAPPPAPGQ